MDTSPILPIPRLRLTRHSPQAPADTLTPIAGPSRLSPRMPAHENDEDEDDADSTPRMPAASIAPDANAGPAPLSDMPSTRLRAILARIPNSSTSTSATPHATSFAIPHVARASEPTTPSEPDSDFDPPYSTLATPSIARESLKELVSYALRDPGSTPQKAKIKTKGRLRRNSIDTSEVAESSHIEKTRIGDKGKGKRRSMSDEEAEHLSNLSRRSEDSESVRSPAATFDALRARLARSGSQSQSFFPSPPRGGMVMDMSMPPTHTSDSTDAMRRGSEPDAGTEGSEDTATLLRELKMERERERHRNQNEDRPELEEVVNEMSTQPDATSTPLRTFQMSTAFQAESNLLEGDSDMQKALRGMDSYESDSVALPNGRPLSFPSSRPNANTDSVTPASVPVSTPARPLSWTSHSKSHSAHNLPLALLLAFLVELPRAFVVCGAGESYGSTS